jgi:hypothetical protein
MNKKSAPWIYLTLRVLERKNLMQSQARDFRICHFKSKPPCDFIVEEIDTNGIVDAYTSGG